jgi:hypothetical protein
MSTQCGVAVKTEKGYETIYVHSDGYPAYMWPMLTKNYNSEELAAKLISFGDASYIDILLEPTSDFHKFGMPEPDVCMFYHRDRGEAKRGPTPYPTKSVMFSNYYYSYIWEDGKWNFYQGGRKTEYNG